MRNAHISTQATNFTETEMDRRNEADGVLVFLGQVRVTVKAACDTNTVTLHAKYPKPTNITTILILKNTL